MMSGLSLPHWSDLVLWYLAFLGAMVTHEAAHAWAAMKLGDRTAFDSGQVTLDPTPHLRREPFGTVVVPLISFLLGGWMIGWASTPYNRDWSYRYPKRAALMALAGPTANFGLVLLAALLIRIGMLLEYFHPPARLGFTSVVAAYQPGVPEGLAVLLSIIFSLNLILLIFNLLPVPPLDGSAILPLFLSDTAAIRYRRFMENSTYALFGLILAWKFFGSIFRPVHLFALNLLYPGSGYQ